jgi:hypothetical protein
MTRKRKEEPQEKISERIEMAVPISEFTHIYLRANDSQIIMEIITHSRDAETGDPVDLSGSITVMSPERFKQMAAYFWQLSEKLESKEVH